MVSQGHVLKHYIIRPWTMGSMNDKPHPQTPDHLNRSFNGSFLIIFTLLNMFMKSYRMSDRPPFQFFSLGALRVKINKFWIFVALNSMIKFCSRRYTIIPYSRTQPQLYRQSTDLEVRYVTRVFEWKVHPSYIHFSLIEFLTNAVHVDSSILFHYS